jgi:hypothetical protein
MNSSGRRHAIALIALGTLAITQASAQRPKPPPAIEPKAVDILKAGCATLEAAKAMSLDALSTYEHGARNGQPLFYSVLKPRHHAAP